MNKKIKFNILDYKGMYVMHCDTKDKAITFAEYMKLGSEGIDRIWDEECENTCFDFNEIQLFGNRIICYGHIELYNKKGYTVLEFDNFDWDEVK